MRILTTILMLCLPTAAMGETFMCRTEVSTSTSDGRNTVHLPEVSFDYVLDSEKGIRAFSKDMDFDYRGSCQSTRGLFICSHEDEERGVSEQIILTLEVGIFTRASQNYEAGIMGPLVASGWGRCIEI